MTDSADLLSVQRQKKGKSMRIPDRLDIRIGDKLMISLQSADDDSDFWLHKDPPVLMTAGVRQKF